MPKLSQHVLIWSEVHRHYELYAYGQLEQRFSSDGEAAFSRWLGEHVAFAFEGRAGKISVLKEARSARTGYWYAYRTQNRRTSKRYLGRTEKVTFAQLERAAKVLERELSLTHPHPSSIPLKEDEQRMTILLSKLSYPRLPNTLVERERLLCELEAAFTHRLTLVSASAGSGKTTLLSAWATLLSAVASEENKPALAWLSLDALDNDPIRFWDSIITALHPYLPRQGKAALSMLHASQSPPLSTILMALLNEIGLVGRDIVFVLDDYHVISDQAIHEAMLFLVDQLPVNMHLVLATRIDPTLPLARWRVRGQMVEIRDSDLRFTEAETNRFLTQGMRLTLSKEDVAILTERTEGWIAGLQLAALSMRKRQDLSGFVKDFTGSHRFLLDYVQQEILGQLPARLQHFLLQTSILASLNAALCQAVTALPSQQEGQEILETLERANLFVVPLDEQRQWYRFHDLFRQTLIARLHASQTDLVPSLHQRAARWYGMQGELREAITHALTAPDYPLAASLMEQAAPQFWLSGEAKTVHTWVCSLPDVVLRAHIRLALNAALRFLNSIHLSTETAHARMVAQIEQMLVRLQRLLHSQQEPGLSDEEGALIERRIRLLRALIEVRAILKHVDEDRLRHLSQEIEALPPDEEVSWNMIPLTFTYWLTFTIGGQGALLIPRLLAMKQQGIQAGDHLATIRVMYWLAMVYEQAGQFHQAQQQCRQALALIEQTGGRTAMAGYLHYSLFNVYYAWNQLDEASDWLQRLLTLAQDWQQVELIIIGNAALAELSMANGDLQAAQEALRTLEPLVEQEGFANHTPWLSTIRVQWWLAQGNLQAASEWAAQASFSPETWEPLRKFEFLVLVRVFLTQQRYTLALEMLERFSTFLDRPADIKTSIQFLILQVIALHHGGHHEQARVAATRLLAMTEPENNIRVYLGAGLPMQQVLLALQTPSSASAFVARVLSAFERQKYGKVADAQITAVEEEQPRSSLGTSSCVQPETYPLLTPQEMKVLRLLVVGRTYAEMAEELIVSLNTIKTQISSIYRKLGVSRRAEAIAASQRLRLF